MSSPERRNLPGGSADLARLGDAIRAAQDDTLARRDDLGRVRARLLSRPARRAIRWPTISLASGAMVAVAAVIAIVIARDPPGRSADPGEPSLAFRVGDEAESGAEPRWIAADEVPVPVRFEDGSEVALTVGAQARVEASSARHARVRVERGRVEARVVHEDARRWSFEAGPFSVEVVGTTFALEWDPESARARLGMREGVVVLRGPHIGERRVNGGESIEVWTREGRVVSEPLTTTAAPEPATDSASETGSDTDSASESVSDSDSASESVSDSEPASDSASDPASASESDSTAPRWLTLARTGHPADAVREAERVGWSGIAATARSADLVRLGEAARLSGASERAVSAYLSVRQRFPGSSDAARAAFLLGRVHQEALGDPRAAARWYATSLREQPAGRLARDAAGRRIEALRASGDAAGAREASTAYLAQHPTGPHAELARRVLDDR